MIISIALSGLGAQQLPLRLSPMFGDHAVLQRSRVLRVFGTGTPGSQVEINLNVANGKGKAIVGEDGTWLATIGEQKAGGPYTLSVRSGAEKLVSRDVWIGDVWVCSGQSNMEWPVAKCKEADAMRAGASNQIRLVRLPKVSTKDQNLSTAINAEWQVADPKVINTWSGIGYSFGMLLSQNLDVPVGLVQASWGGTMIESWMSPRAIQQTSFLGDYVQRYRNQQLDYPARLREWESSVREWDETNEKRDPGNKGYDQGWAKNSFNDEGWQSVEVPGTIESDEGRDVDGAVWYRKEFELPEDWQGKGLRLRLGFIGTDDQTYVNGLKVGGSLTREKLRNYYVGPGVLRRGKNLITVRVWNRSGEGGLLGPDIDIGPVDSPVVLSLNGAWKSKAELLLDGNSGSRPARPLGPGDKNALSGAYNGMIAPIKDLSVKGWIWYQGEANVGRPEEYRQSFVNFIKELRTDFRNPNMPFLYVQLPGFSQGKGTEWAELRLAQDAAMDLPYTAMAVTTDLAEVGTIHPLRKLETGRRLANLAMNVAYAKPNPSRFALAGTVKFNGPTVRIAFQNAYGEILADGAVRGLEIRDKAGQWVEAKAWIEGSNLRAEAPGVAEPTGIRYNFANHPLGNLRSKVGLPVAPFLWFPGR